VQVQQTSIPEVLILEPKVLRDERGFFFESYNKVRFDELVQRDVNFVQDNHSRSARGVLRGLHYQLPPRAQGKLVRVAVGEVFDVAVDIRRSSRTFGQWVGVHLSAENARQLWIPEGFAHGFVTLSEAAELLYKTTDGYAAELDRSLAWNDPEIGIDWPAIDALTLSARDKAAQPMSASDLFD
jgi:dTDP-4-dehydrorhamnose 3,5-epimerase